MTVNLIPPKLKAQKELTNILSQIIFGLAIVLLMLTIMAGALYVYSSSIQNDLRGNKETLEEQSKRLKGFLDIENLVKKSNKKLSAIDNVLTTRAAWSDVIVNISGFTPPNVQIKSMDLNSTSHTVTIQGVATTRKDIALFKEKLETSNFKNVTFASSSYNQNTDDYTFSLSLALEDKK